MDYWFQRTNYWQKDSRRVDATTVAIIACFVKFADVVGVAVAVVLLDEAVIVHFAIEMHHVLQTKSFAHLQRRLGELVTHYSTRSMSQDAILYSLKVH